VMVVDRRQHQGGPSIPAHGGHGGGGEPRSADTLALGTRSTQPRPAGMAGGPGGQPHFF
jgi:hypothetical protein